MKLYNAMSIKLKKQLKPSLKQHTLSNLFNTLHYLFIYFTMTEEDQHDQYADEIAKIMLEIELEEDSNKQTNFKDYIKQLVIEIRKDFPSIRRIKKPVLKTSEQLREEAI